MITAVSAKSTVFRGVTPWKYLKIEIACSSDPLVLIYQAICRHVNRNSLHRFHRKRSETKVIEQNELQILFPAFNSSVRLTVLTSLKKRKKTSRNYYPKSTFTDLLFLQPTTVWRRQVKLNIFLISSKENYWNASLEGIPIPKMSQEFLKKKVIRKGWWYYCYQQQNPLTYS